MLTCGACGHKNTAQSNFCSHCGERLTGAPAGETTSIIPVVLDDVAAGELSEADEATLNELPQGNALLVVRRGSSGDERFLLDQARTVAGRHPDSDIFLDDITVSRHHAEFLIEGGELTVRDMGSLNGTYVNRKLVDGAAVLRTGDEVQIGKFRMVCFVSAHGLG